MSRRFRRLRKFANRVVEVTRHVWRVCTCCGSMNQEIQREMVPEAAVLSGNLPSRNFTSVPRAVGTPSVCCFAKLGEIFCKRDIELNNELSSANELLGTELSLLSSSDTKPKQEFSNINDSTAESPTNHGYIRNPRIEGGSYSSTLNLHQSSSTSLFECNILKQFYGRISPLPFDFTKPDTGILSQRQFPTQRNTTRPLPRVQFNPKISSKVFIVEGPLYSTRQARVEELMCKRNKRHAAKVSTKSAFGRPSSVTLEYAENDKWKFIYPAQWSVRKNLSRGNSSSVDLTILEEYKRQLVVKTLMKAGSDLESEILAECQSSYVVKFCACIAQGDSRYLCMEYYERQDLAVCLRKDGERIYIKELEATWICAYVLSSLEYLHDRDILHLDINSSNILIDDRGYPVLTDFSKAQRMAAFESDYVAPDVYIKDNRGSREDIVSVACLLFEIVTRNCSWRSDGGAWLKNLSMDMSLSISARDYIMTQLNTTESWRMGDVEQHPVFSKVDWSEVRSTDRARKCRLNKVFTMIENADWLANNKPDPDLPDPRNSACAIDRGDVKSPTDAPHSYVLSSESKIMDITEVATEHQYPASQDGSNVTAIDAATTGFDESSADDSECTVQTPQNHPDHITSAPVTTPELAVMSPSESTDDHDNLIQAKSSQEPEKG